MKFFSLLSAVLVCVEFAHAQAEFPAWFCETPSYFGVACAVGYAGVYEHPQSSYDEAFRDAALRLFTDRETHIIGESGFLSGPDGKIALGDNFRIEVDTAGFAGFSSSLVRLDSALVGDLVIMLLGTGQIPKLESARILPGRPSWTETLPDDQTHFYAVGLSAVYAHSESSWREAERRARLELALTAQCKIEGLERQLDSYHESVSNLQTDVFFQRIQTVARWQDPKTGVCWVLVSGN